MREIELIEKRKRREKHFLREDGTIRAEIYDENIHYLENGKYKEIDNSLIEKNGYYSNKANDYKVHFSKNSKHDLMTMEVDQHYINMYLKSNKEVIMKDIINDSNLKKHICYEEIMDGVDFDYKILPTKIKESIIIKNRASYLDKIVFAVESDLDLVLNSNGTIDAKCDNKIIFNIDAPYMVDNNGKKNKNVYYLLEKVDNGYNLTLKLDVKWLLDQDTCYPVIIDPTITNSNENNSVYDTYIYPGDTNADRNNQELLKAGVDRIDGVDIINRALIKFELPTISTGSQIINAQLNLVGYPCSEENAELIDFPMVVHQITETWNEETANWDTMHDKYNPKVETCFLGYRSYTDNYGYYEISVSSADITNIVKKWYSDTPNNGVMVKIAKEEFMNGFAPIFYSKNNNISGSNPKPYLSITYRNQNGIEDYLNYKKYSFSQGVVNVNTFNGNLVSIFNIGSTVGSKLSAKLNLIYNTNDVILEKNFGFGLGNRTNYNQTIREEEIEETKYLAYEDSDGTIHYFVDKADYFEEEDGVFVDEDGLNMTITQTETEYTLKDKNGNIATFKKINNIGYLEEFKDVSGNAINVSYNSDNLISKIKDSNNDEININYLDNKIEIVTSSETITLNYSLNKVTSIEKNSGITSFTYNIKNLIDSITDENGIKMIFEYYEQLPYRFKKATEYGKNNTLGKYSTFNYNFNTTIVTDEKNRTSTLIFNDFGTLISVSNLSTSTNIKNAYGKELTYGSYAGDMNKLISDGSSLKYVKNYFNNMSFEKSEINFTASSDEILSITNEYAVTGVNSLKVETLGENKKILQSIIIIPGQSYTFSAYLKNNNSVKMKFYYTDANSNIIENSSELITTNLNFSRYDMTVDVPEDALSEVTVGFYFENSGITYIDDIQLEEGKVVNHHNLIENSDFSQGFDNWMTDDDSEHYEIVDIGNNNKALKIKMEPTYGTGISKNLNLSGKKGDRFNLSFWYKNEGIKGGFSYNHVIFDFAYINLEYGKCALMAELNYNNESWQFFSTNFTAEADYSDLSLQFFQSFNANDLYITNFCFFKDVNNERFEYDEKGNVINSLNKNNTEEKFNYNKDNRLISMVNVKGNRFIYEYDNLINDRVFNAISADGIVNKIIYDDYGNPLFSKTLNTSINEDIEAGFYRIRLKGTDKYIRNVNNNIVLQLDDCYHDIWILEELVEEEEKYFKIKSSLLNDRYLNENSTNLIIDNTQNLGAELILEANENGSYYVKLKSNNLYLKDNNGTLKFSELIDDDDSFQFYFEKYDFECHFIENSSIYELNGKFLKEVIDDCLNHTQYDVDEITGLVNSMTNAKNIIKYYDYNSKHQLVSITIEDRKVDFEYNASNQITKIISGNKEYLFEYDEFYRIVSIKLGNISLINIEYNSNNGKMKSYTYANNQKIEFEYDEFDRIKILKKMDAIYEYYYNNNGEIAKIIFNDNVIKYNYNISQKISKYCFNDFEINYNYDDDDNIIQKEFNYDLSNYIINSSYSNDSMLTNTNFENNNIDYNYDQLGRLVNKKINDTYSIEYDYIFNGKRETNKIKSINLNGNKYLYIYDKLYNITHIYINNNLQIKYIYNDYNELIQENNYLNNTIIKYKYDDFGNILSTKEYSMKTFALIEANTYEYSDLNWKDKLTKYNNISITYDANGNPLNIGEEIILNWKNGKELSSYQDSTNTISYKYDNKGNRIEKIVNNIITKYYLEDNKIIFEDSQLGRTFYLYDEDGEIIGFKYNENLYFYIKNLQKDIIKIIDANNNVVAEYEYDSWGNIVHIFDADGNIITDTNHIANINPFRFRSYYFDKETNLYYLNKRYYNPIWKRFINADSYIKTNNDYIGYNLFAYAGNNPVNNIDLNGNLSFDVKSWFSKTTKKVKKKASKTWKKIKKAFTFEVGVGFGLGGSASVGKGKVKAGVSASAYNDFNWGYSNGKTYNSSTSSGSVGVSIFEIGGSITHIDDNKVNENGSWHDNVMLIPWEVWDCPNTTREVTFGLSEKNFKGNAPITDPDAGFIGIDFDLHFVIGGHVKIGFSGIDFNFLD